MSQNFRPEDANGYDQKITIVVPGYSILHQSAAALLRTLLPDDARILIIGAGTGADTLALAQQNPDWQQTCVEPLAEMLDRAREKTAALPHITYHHGYLADLPPDEPYDAALCQLVSHFIPERAAKAQLLRDIAARLKPGGYLIQTDIIESDELPALIHFARAQGMPPEGAPLMEKRFSEDIHPLAIKDLPRLAAENGYRAQKTYFRTLTICGWLLQRTA